MGWLILKKIKELVSWGSFVEKLWTWGPFVIGAILSGGTVIWGFLESVPLPLLVMNGIALFLVLIWLPLMPGLYRLLKASKGAPLARETPKRPEPQYALWRRMDRYTLDQIAYLWLDADPHVGLPIKDGRATETVRTTFRNAIKSGKLRPASGKRDDLLYPTGATEITRADLIAYASAHGDNPKFLKDTD